MPDVMTRADSLRSYLTGAAADGNAQTVPDLSLGNYRSSTEWGGLSIRVTDAINNVTVNFAGGGNALGSGALECTGADALRWNDFGGDPGDPVTITNGQTKLLEALGRPGAFLRVTRTSATALVAGTSVVALSSPYNNLFGMDNVLSADATAGITQYRGFVMKNVSAVTVKNLKRWVGELAASTVSGATNLGGAGSGTISAPGGFPGWPSSGYCHVFTSGGVHREIVYYSSRTATSLTVPASGRGLLGGGTAAGASGDILRCVPGIAVAINDAGVQAAGAAIQTIANDETAPTGVVWNTGLDSATGLAVGDLTAGQQVGIWVKRAIPAGAVALPSVKNLINGSFETV